MREDDNRSESSNTARIICENESDNKHYVNFSEGNLGTKLEKIFSRIQSQSFVNHSTLSNLLFGSRLNTILN